MKNYLIRSALVTGVAMAIAIAGFGVSAARAAGLPTCGSGFSVTGLWNVNQAAGNYTGTQFQLVLQQTGTSVTGAGYDNVNNLTASITGTQVGSSIDLIFVWPTGVAEYVGTVTSGGMSGTAGAVGNAVPGVTTWDTEGPSQTCSPAASPPATKDDCKNGGWQTHTDANGTAFKNQGDCVSYVATKGKNGAG